MRRAAFVAVTAMVASCGGPQKGHDQHEDISALWTQIREWRHEAGMQLDPRPESLMSVEKAKVADERAICVSTHVVPPTCSQVCGLSDAICDNAEQICKLADELGKDDSYAQDKCTDAKASCREAKQLCCGCSTKP